MRLTYEEYSPRAGSGLVYDLGGGGLGGYFQNETLNRTLKQILNVVTWDCELTFLEVSGLQHRSQGH